MKATNDLDIYAHPDDALTLDGQDVNTVMPDRLTQDALRTELGLEWQALEQAAEDEYNQFLSDMQASGEKRGFHENF